MRQVLSVLELHSILERLGKALHDRSDALTREQLPERWVDMIRYLDEKERQQSEPPKHEAPPRKTKA